MSKGFENRFELPPDTLHEVVQKFKPEFVDHGNEQLVYQCPDHPGVVIKVNIDSIENSLKWLQDNQLSSNKMLEDGELMEAFNDAVRVRNKSFQELKTHFSEAHVLPQRLVLIKVPRVVEVVDAIAEMRTGYGVVQDGLPDELYVAATVQKKLPALQTGEATSLNQPYAQDFNAAFFNNVHHALCPKLGTVQHYVAPEVMSDTTKRAAVADFVERAIAYSMSTGKILDVAGSDNVVLVPGENNAQNYILVDALYPNYGSANLADFKSHAQSIVDNRYSKTNALEIVNGVLNLVNYAICINGLASELGLDSRLDYFEDQFSNPANYTQVETFIKDCFALWQVEQTGDTIL